MMKKEDYYYLFGVMVVSEFESGGVEDVIKAIKDGYSYNLHHYNTERNTLSDLLNEYEGYSSFVEIDKLTYDQLQKAISKL